MIIIFTERTTTGAKTKNLQLFSEINATKIQTRPPNDLKISIVRR